eukprot:CAMPEP_0113607520 /NCGR_PEP_ID=MMETSP0017_2-20120614/3430_1 /TAXON_ID=2856 /ORGANISM="Cylindrotheca closterium" /LENGTH=316 /DNA_ID=CAMNT_0000516133 /DNA_START=223 /DNA_END=1173 /DNA_ORIENTATION=+ /assembly_acc=CAM_ASM_000147
MSMASAPYEVKLDNNEQHEYGEFGRSVKPKKRRVAKHEPTEADILYRELIEDVQLMEFASMSMSMSMGMSLDDTQVESPSSAPAPPTGTPTAPQTSSPIEAIANSASSCDEQLQVLINIPLEVDTATADTDIETLVAEALKETLGDEYNFCGSRRLLDDGSSIVEDFQLGTITITKDANETCPPTDPSTSCQVANAAIVVSGEVDGAAAQLRNSLGFLFENDIKFVEELPQSGVIEVRLKEGGGEAEANSVPSAFGNSAQPTRSAVVAILSTAGVSIVAAIILRARRKERMAAADKFCESDSEGETLPINNVSGVH